MEGTRHPFGRLDSLRTDLSLVLRSRMGLRQNLLSPGGEMSLMYIRLCGFGFGDCTAVSTYTSALDDGAGRGHVGDEYACISRYVS